MSAIPAIVIIIGRRRSIYFNANHMNVGGRMITAANNADLEKLIINPMQSIHQINRKTGTLSRGMDKIIPASKKPPKTFGWNVNPYARIHHVPATLIAATFG